MTISSPLPLRGTPTSTRTLLARLIEAPHLDRIVRELPSERFVALIRELGVADAGELVALATTEQLVAAFDEDLFTSSRPGERERFDRHRFVMWLEVLFEAGDRAVARRMAELSEDFVALALSSLVLVFDHEQLRERISEADDDDAEAADDALARALNEEIDGYLLVARDDEGWDAALALVLALDRFDRALLVRLLDRCTMHAREYVDDLDALGEVLSEAESLAEDVEAAREQRRAEFGHVEPRAAKGFLALARTPMPGPLEQQTRDANTRAYLRELASPRARTRAQPHADDKLARMLAQLGPDDAPQDAGPGMTLALRELARDTPPRFHERLGELAYLANVVLAAVPDEQGLRLRQADAAELALATVAYGAELYARERRVEVQPFTRASADELREVLEQQPADLLFRKACSTLVARGVADGLVRSRAQLEQALAALDNPALAAAPEPANTRASKPKRSTLRSRTPLA